MKSIIPEPTREHLAEIAAGRQQAWKNGFRPLAIVAAQDAQGPGKRPAGACWQERARLDPPEAAGRDAYADAPNTGVLADGLQIIDIDCSRAADAASVRALAETMLGKTPGVRRRANSNKLAMLYRAAEGEPPTRFLEGVEHNPDAGVGQRIDVLGCGSQLVVDGWHESGVEIEWEADHPMRGLTAAALPAVSEERVAAFLDAAERLIGRSTAGRHRDYTVAKHDTRLDDPLWPAPVALDALHAIPNRVDALPSWGDLLSVLGGFRRVLGRDADQHMEAARAWATRFGWCDDQQFERKWQQAAETYVGEEMLAIRAGQFGWTMPPTSMNFGAYDTPEPVDPLAALPYVTAEVLHTASALPPTPMLLGYAYERGAISVLAGAGASAKTNVSLVEGIAMATDDSDMLGARVWEPGLRVLFLNFDENLTEMTKRLAMAAGCYGIAPEAIGDRIVIASPPASLFVLSRAEGRGYALNEAGFANLAAMIRRHRADVVNLDPLGPLLAGLVDNDIAYMVIERLRRVAEETNCAIQLVHHQNKAGMNGDASSATAVLGAVALVNGARLARVITPLGRKELGLVTEPELRARLFRISNAKANHAPPSAKTVWWERVEAKLGNGQGRRYGDRTGIPMRFAPPTTDQVDPALMDQVAAEIGRAWAIQQGYAPPGKKAADGRRMSDLAAAVGLKDEAAMREMVKALIKQGRVVRDEQTIAGSANRHPVEALRRV
ncbi:AAA family ATPase [Roseicella sp. DB1501]|uniref:AAA family ATPase n=1 Tax=Roseicella sp. DB1501 TaxID=2730925 RepID=UPI001490F34E|nr:AAA family ATPase [Roseicella sp. DB1501]NOG69785.1 AAA family ATPase [Roseicella sp. DB1501]